ncbi:MAG TPA: hypothetical protein VLR49_10820 [Ferruginibacter sp.]|nr:hypothetical protein [Ferruginibacter sp.]
MISVTGEYLISIIERHVNKTIRFRRIPPGEPSNDVCKEAATNEEIADFILSIPYFHNGLKDFILGNSNERTIIVSQPWEIAFIIRTKKWAECDDWLHQSFIPSPKFYTGPVQSGTDSLKLPY